MLMKVFNKGQVVIPSAMRKKLKLEVGDLLDVSLDESENALVLTKLKQSLSSELAGSFAKHAEGKPFPTKSQMEEALRKGLIGE
jgi:AbrB family looped-hinge helix DNA binding protein